MKAELSRDMGRLSVYYKYPNGNERLTWKRNTMTDYRLAWEHLMIMLPSDGVFSIVIEAKVKSENGDIAIDDIAINLCSSLSELKTY